MTGDIQRKLHEILSEHRHELMPVARTLIEMAIENQSRVERGEIDEGWEEEQTPSPTSNEG